MTTNNPTDPRFHAIEISCRAMAGHAKTSANGENIWKISSISRLEGFSPQLQTFLQPHRTTNTRPVDPLSILKNILNEQERMFILRAVANSASVTEQENGDGDDQEDDKDEDDEFEEGEFDDDGDEGESDEELERDEEDGEDEDLDKSEEDEELTNDDEEGESELDYEPEEDEERFEEDGDEDEFDYDEDDDGYNDDEYDQDAS